MQEIGQITAELLDETKRRMAERAGRIPARFSRQKAQRNGNGAVKGERAGEHSGSPVNTNAAKNERGTMPSRSRFLDSGVSAKGNVAIANTDYSPPPSCLLAFEDTRVAARVGRTQPLVPLIFDRLDKPQVREPVIVPQPVDVVNFHAIDARPNPIVERPANPVLGDRTILAVYDAVSIEALAASSGPGIFPVPSVELVDPAILASGTRSVRDDACSRVIRVEFRKSRNRRKINRSADGPLFALLHFPLERVVAWPWERV